MISKTIKIPGKTFFLGEYAVLEGGPAITIAHQPYFLLSDTALSHSQIEPYHVHPKSPAGLLQQSLKADKESSCLFYDPYHLGGLGASSAEFLSHYIRKHDLNALSNTYELWKMLQKFRELTQTEQGKPPSGIDLIAQFAGSITVIEQSSHQVTYKTHGWPFKDLAFMLIHTGKKINTHDHLAELQHIPSEELSSIVHTAQKAFAAQDSKALVECVNQYRATLENAKLLAEHSKKLINCLKSYPGIVASKGCGALGADLVCILVQADKKAAVRNSLEKLSLRIIATEVDLARGAHYHHHSL